MYLIKVKHIGGEVLIQRNMTVVPRRQECILIGKEQYVVVAVFWNYNDARTVTVSVRNL